MAIMADSNFHVANQHVIHRAEILDNQSIDLSLSLDINFQAVSHIDED